MNTGNYDIKKLHAFIAANLSGVSANVFQTNRPIASEQMQDFVVVALPANLADKIGCGSTMCRISLYARDIAGKWENLPRLSEMQQALYSVLPMSNGSYTVSRPVYHAGGSDSLGFHVGHVTLNVLIK